MHPILNIAVKAARQAEKIIMRSIDRLDSVKVSEKGHHDFVTEVDTKAEEAIIQVIKDAYPAHAIIAEERGEMEGEEFTWIIDPLDGTVNYLHQFPFFAISIAVKRGDTLEHAVVYDPIRDEMYTASRGDGALLNNRRIRVSSNFKMGEALIGTGFPTKEIHHFQAYMRTFETIFPQTLGVRRAGAAALDLAYVAAGRLDGFWEISLKEWDMAAGALLIKEAGGYVSDLRGTAEYLESHQIVAGNPKIHKLLLQEIQRSLSE